MSFIKAIRSDFKVLYPKFSFLSVVKALINPSFHAAFLIRCAQYSPVWLFWVFRLILISKHSIDFGKGCSIGYSIRLPHPIGIVFGGGAVIGNDCVIYQNVTLGLHKAGYPKLCDKVVLYGNTVIVGPITLGNEVTVGALQFVSKDLHSGTTYGNKK